MVKLAALHAERSHLPPYAAKCRGVQPSCREHRRSSAPVRGQDVMTCTPCPHTQAASLRAKWGHQVRPDRHNGIYARLRESAGRLQEGHLRSREALHTLSACVTAFLSSFIKWRALSSSLAAAASYRLRLWPAPIALAGEARQTGTVELDVQNVVLDRLL